MQLLWVCFLFTFGPKKTKLDKTNNNNKKRKIIKKRNLSELFNSQVKNVNQIGDLVTLVFVLLDAGFLRLLRVLIK